MGSEGSERQSSDPVGDFQRWLMRAGARRLGRDVADQVRNTINGGRRTSGEVWEIATTEPPPDEAPECAWCPICRAARRYREGSAAAGVAGTAGASGASGPGAAGPGSGLGSQLAGVSETLAGLAQDAFSIFDAALRSSQQRPGTRPGKAPGPTGTGWPTPPPAGTGTNSGDGASSGDGPISGDGPSSDDGPVVGTPPVVGWPAVHPQDQHGEAANEGGDREERGEPGDGPADDSGDDQIERPAE